MELEFMRQAEKILNRGLDQYVLKICFYKKTEAVLTFSTF